MAQSIETYRGVAYPWHCDSMGHMNTQFYAAMFDAAGWHILSRLGPYAELKPRGIGWADVRQLIEYKHEVPAGSLIFIRTTLQRIGTKSVQYLHEMVNSETDVLHATSENVTVLFDMVNRAAVPLDDAIRRRCEALLD